VVTGVTVGAQTGQDVQLRQNSHVVSGFENGKAVLGSASSPLTGRPPPADKAAQLAFWEGYATATFFPASCVTITMPEGEPARPASALCNLLRLRRGRLDCKEVMQEANILPACLNGAYYSPIGCSHA
jgi:hypothetical protein